MKVLILGGTTEASALARALAERPRAARRVAAPKPQPLPTRVGGFGGADGLAAFLAAERITHLVDATHPFAEQMSRHAVAAAKLTGTALIALTRPPWAPQDGDRWQRVAGIEAAVAALAGPPERVLLAIGRLHLAAFAARPEHHYVLRLVDLPVDPPPLPRHTLTVDRGPFTREGDLALMREHGVERLVCKNAGGAGAAAKLEAARALGIPVVMIDRPALPPRREAHSPNAVLNWLGHCTASNDGTERGV